MLGNWWVAEALEQGPVVLVSWVVWVIGSIVLHELAHGWAAIWRGDRTPIETGHMTWNPLVHMGQMSLIVFAVIGIAWGAMPVNPLRFRGRYDDAIVSAAGPAMNLALAALALVAFCLWSALAGGVGEPLRQNLAIFLYLGATLNIVLMLFNLVPIPPLDGSRIIATFAPAYRRLWEGQQAQMAGLIAFAALFFFGSDYIWAAADRIMDAGVGAVMSVIA